MNSFEKWRLLGCRIDQMDEVQFQLNSVFIYSWNINLKFTKMKKQQTAVKWIKSELNNNNNNNNNNNSNNNNNNNNNNESKMVV